MSTANTNVLGYQTNVQNGNLIAARNAAIDLGDGHIALVQSFRGSASHQIDTVYEVGSSAIYLVVGNPSAEFSCSTLVSKDGFFAPFYNMSREAACGTMRTINVNLGSELECDPVVTSKATAKFTGALLESLGFGLNAGQTSIAQNASFKAGSLEVV